MSKPFFKTSQFYNLLYDEKSSDLEVDYVLDLLRRHKLEVKDILEFGCGTGRHSELIAKRGINIHGIELSQNMLNQIKKIDRFTYQQGNITDARVQRKFDSVISLFHVINYLNTNQEISDVFKNAFQHLKQNGIFLFDIWYSAAVISEKPAVRVKNFKNQFYEITRIAIPEIDYLNNTVKINYTFYIQDIKSNNCEKFCEIHKLRYFSIPELDYYASTCGFKRLLAEEWITKKIPSDKTWGVCLAYKKL